MNPILDILCEGEALRFDGKIFAEAAFLAGGGATINAARGLRALGKACTAYLVLGGGVGRLIREQLSREQLPYCWSANGASSRIALISGSQRRQRMFVTPSPAVSRAAIRRFADRYLAAIAAHDIIVIGGSVPDASADDAVSHVVRPLISSGRKVIIDSRGAFARRAYRESPYAAKYSPEQVHAAAGSADAVAKWAQAALGLHRKGIALVACNTGEVCYAAYGGSVWRYWNPGRLRRRVYGRGDAFVSGLASALLDGAGPPEAVRFALACGAAFRSSFPLGSIDPELTHTHMRNIRCSEEEGLA